MRFARTFPATHPRKGEPTYFVEKIRAALVNDTWDIYDELKRDFSIEMYLSCDPKFHTIRFGRHWKVGDRFVPKIWTGAPYRSKTLAFGPPIEVKKVWDIRIGEGGFVCEGELLTCDLSTLAENDGLTLDDFWAWMNPDTDGYREAQIICWSDEIEY